TNNGLQTHNFGQFTASPPPAKGKKPRHVSNEEWIAVSVGRSIGTGSVTKAFTKKFVRKLSSEGWKLPMVGTQDLPTAMRNEMKDGASIEAAVKRALGTLVPGFAIPSGWFFRPLDVGDGYAIETNFDFASLNKEYSKTIPSSHSVL